MRRGGVVRRSWTVCASAFVVASAIAAAGGFVAATVAAGGAVAVVATLDGLVDGAPTRAMALVVAGWFAGLLYGGWDALEERRASRVAERIGEAQIRRVVEGVVTRGPRWRRTGWSFEVRVESLDGEPLERPTYVPWSSPASTGRVRVFLPGEPLSEPGRRLPLPGDRVRTFLTLEQYPERRFPSREGFRARMRDRGIVARAVVEDDVEVSGRASGTLWSVRRRLADWRTRYVRALVTRLPADRAAFAAAITAGERGLLAAEQTDPFWATETGHLLAISGLHLGIVAGMVWWALGFLVARWTGLIRRVGFRRATGVAVLVFLAGYVLLVGAPVSACRALLMTGGAVLANALRRPVSPMRALAMAAAMLVVAEPDAPGRLGFQLSFAATAGILLVVTRPPRFLEADPLEESTRLERWGRRVGLGVAASVGATLATWPVLLAWHGAVSPHALWVNVVVTPLVGTLVVPVAALGAAVTAASRAIGTWLAGIAGAAMEALGEALRACEFAAEPVVTGAIDPWCAVAAGLGVGWMLASRLRWRPLACGGTLALLAVLAGRPAPNPDALRVHFIPVGQGDAILVEWPGDRTMLVDAGGSRWGDDPGRTVVVPYLRRRGIDRLDWVVATHGDVDHVGGLAAVADELDPRRFVAPRVEGIPRLREVRRRMRRAGAEPMAPEEVARNWTDRGRIDCSAPGEPGGSENDRSVVCRLAYAGRSILLAGDIERGAENQMIRGGRPLEADLLKVPHHGSKTSSTPAWLDRVAPDVAVVSAGRFNPFGHPADSVVRRYETRGIELLETSRRGLILAAVGADGSMDVRVAHPGR